MFQNCRPLQSFMSADSTYLLSTILIMGRQGHRS